MPSWAIRVYKANYYVLFSIRRCEQMPSFALFLYQKPLGRSSDNLIKEQWEKEQRRERRVSNDASTSHACMTFSKPTKFVWQTAITAGFFLLPLWTAQWICGGSHWDTKRQTRFNWKLTKNTFLTDTGGYSAFSHESVKAKKKKKNHSPMSKKYRFAVRMIPTQLAVQTTHIAME